MNRQEFTAMVAKRRTLDMPSPSKYKNVKTRVDGITFDSKAEANRYIELKHLRDAGEIAGFARQPSFMVSREVRYIPDFIVWDKTCLHWVEDVKGHETEAFKIKAKLFREMYPFLELRLIR